MEQETIFTKIIKREIPSSIIFEDENHLAFLDIMPFEKGHTLVIPKKPYETIFEMPEEEFLELMRIVYRVSNHIAEMMNCGMNIVQNNKAISGQEIPHVHFHLMPRLDQKKLMCLENRDEYLENEIENYKNKLKMGDY